MKIDFHLGETLFVSNLFKGTTNENKTFSIITTWDTKYWNVDEIIFDDPNDNNDLNRQQVLEFFNSQMNK